MKLLVSVRNGAEAQVALAAGVDLLDLKEPDAGALGGTLPAVWSEVSQMALGNVPVSAAMGELRDWSLAEFRDQHQHAARLSFAKIGLAGMAEVADWPTRWQEFASALPGGVHPVAVAYADARIAAAPAVEVVVDLAIESQCKALLIDTFDKRGGGLLEHLDLAELARIVSRLRSLGIMSVLAGSLDLAAIELLGGLDENGPDFIAVRGAACEGGRTSRVSAAKIGRIRAQIERSCGVSADRTREAST